MPGPQLYGKPALMAKPRAGHVRPLPLGHFKNSSIIFSPTAPDFSGWNWQPRTLPWVAATVSAAWGAYGASAGFYYNKAKAENTAGGIVFEAACGRQARSGQDCDGWEENG